MTPEQIRIEILDSAAILASHPFLLSLLTTEQKKLLHAVQLYWGSAPDTAINSVLAFYNQLQGES